MRTQKNSTQPLNTKWPHYSEDEIEAVSRVLRSGKVNYWTGNEGRVFEKEFAVFTGCRYAVALANGTVALDVALRALNIGPGDEVITTPRTFIATVSSIVNVGATPVFADVDLNSQNITADSISKVLTKKTKAILVVHLAGFPAEMDQIMDLAEVNKLFVIEDCAQAHGAKYKGRSVGSIGHIGSWSFCQDKIISTGGEGGMVTTNSKELWSKMWSYKDHGKSYDAVYNENHPPGYKWVHYSLGTNYRMTEMQAAIGRIQLKNLDIILNKRYLNAMKLQNLLKNYLEIKFQKVPEYIKHAYYKIYALAESKNLKFSRDHFIQLLTAKGFFCNQGICPEVYLEKSLANFSRENSQRLPNTKNISLRSIGFNIYPNIHH